jgi:enoyl-CoA hydratase/carnithine racemase
MANAAEILLTGKTFDGYEMQRLGVANRVLDAADVLPAAWAYARDMAVHTAPMSVAFSKRVLWQSLDLDRWQINHLETELHHHLMGSPDAKEGVMAFLERRDPQWQGKVSRDWPDTWPGDQGDGR